MNQGINGSMTHGLIDGAGSGHPGHVPWVGGARGPGIRLSPPPGPPGAGGAVSRVVTQIIQEPLNLESH